MPQPGQAQSQQPPDAPGEDPAEPAHEKRKQEDEILAKALMIRALRETLALAKKGPWAEPERPTGHWDFLLREAIWLAVDFSQACSSTAIAFCFTIRGTLLAPNNLSRKPTTDRKRKGSAAHHIEGSLPTAQCLLVQERHWKEALARRIAHEAATFDRASKLRPAEGPFGEEVRRLLADDEPVQVRLSKARNAQGKVQYAHECIATCNNEVLRVL